MTITSYPFDNQDTTEAQFSKLFREAYDSGVVGDITGPGFLCTANGSGLDVQITPGFALLRGHAIDSDGVEQVVLATAEANPRIDRIVLRLNPATNSIAIAVLKGTAAVTPVAVALTQTDIGVFEIPLASIAVAANTLNISQSNITDERPFKGGNVGIWSTSTRPSGSLLLKGRMGYNVTRATWEFWDGTQWDNVGGRKTVRIPHTFHITGDVKVAVGDTDYIPPFFVPVPTGQTVNIVGAYTRVNGGTSATYRLEKNGTIIHGDTVANSTSAFNPTTQGAGSAFANGDRLALVMSSVIGSPKNMTVTVFLDYTF